jgi:tripartite-type tricarboxylate transporter receptor subunit TctC
LRSIKGNAGRRSPNAAMDSSGLPRRSLLAALAAWAGAIPAGRGASAAGSADFPARAVRVVVPYSVGVGPDVVMRSVAERLALPWGRPVIVDNKPGASGIVAFAEVRQTAPDGHTLFLADTATLVVNPLVHASLPYDPVRDLVALTLLFRATFVLWVGAANRFRSIGELLAAARAAPNSVSYATLGNGHASHVAIELLARAAGVRMLHVPFKDAGAMLAAVAASEVDLTAIGAHTVAGLFASGRLRPLAVAAKTRLASHPDIPTLREAGAPAIDMHPWAALMTVAGTPAGTVARLQRDLVVALETPEVRRLADQAGFEITPSTPEAVRERMRSDLLLYAPLVREGRVAQM